MVFSIDRIDTPANNNPRTACNWAVPGMLDLLGFTLFKYHYAELFGTVETRLLPLNGVPGEEMWGGELVTAFIEVGRHLFSTETLNIAAEQRSGGNDLNNTP